MVTNGYSQNQQPTHYPQKGIGSVNEKVVNSVSGWTFDSLLVIHFHPTAQCSCCINVGNFSKKGLEKFYSKPYKEKRIIFREYDIDKDSLIAKRYKIFWSALGFERFSGKEKEFKEIESVWKFCEDKEKFLLNFTKELNAFILEDEKSKTQHKNNAKGDGN